MSRIKIFNIVGARPQFVKMAVVSRALKAFPEIEEVVVHSGQHFDENMSQVFFDELDIPQPHFNLGIAGTGTDDVVHEIEMALRALILREKPDWVLIYGDTYTTKAAALAARYCNVKLAHVEAGLRSFNELMPEEGNRIVADQLSDVLFAPTAWAVANLEQEGLHLPAGRIQQVGDVMYDAVWYYAPIARERIDLDNLIPSDPFLLVTLHRAENTDNPEILGQWVAELNQLADRFNIVMPLHPRTVNRLKSFGLRLVFPAHPPQSYLHMLALLQQCTLVVTDSGGLQKEAFFLKKPCITLRNETEWTELVDAGYNRLVRPGVGALAPAVSAALKSTGSFSETFYGDGTAGNRIAQFLAHGK